VHSLALVHKRASRFPAERLNRRLGAEPGTDSHANSDTAQSESHEDASDEDQNSLLPRWLPDASDSRGWVAKMRADPGRAGAIALAIVAGLAVLVTVFTLVRDRPAPVMSAKLPPVEKAATAGPRSSASPDAGQPTDSDRPVVVSVVGLVHTPGLVTLAPGAHIADALQAAGGR
jgi:competence protein ComEA